MAPSDATPEISRVAVITCASRGLGAAFARVFSEEGFSVALGARDTSAVELAAGLPDPDLPHGRLLHRVQTPEY